MKRNANGDVVRMMSRQVSQSVSFLHTARPTLATTYPPQH